MKTSGGKDPPLRAEAGTGAVKVPGVYLKQIAERALLEGALSSTELSNVALPDTVGTLPKMVIGNPSLEGQACSPRCLLQMLPLSLDDHLWSLPAQRLLLPQLLQHPGPAGGSRVAHLHGARVSSGRARPRAWVLCACTSEQESQPCTCLGSWLKYEGG